MLHEGKFLLRSQWRNSLHSRIWSFNTEFTTACHLFLSWNRWSQSIPTQLSSLRSILTSSSPLCTHVQSGLFNFTLQNFHTLLLSPVVLHTVPISSSLQYMCWTAHIMKLLIMQFSPVSCQVFPIDSKYSHSTLFSNTICLCYPPQIDRSSFIHTQNKRQNLVLHIWIHMILDSRWESKRYGI